MEFEKPGILRLDGNDSSKQKKISQHKELKLRMSQARQVQIAIVKNLTV